MCLLTLFFKSIGDAPVLIGANREEAYARQGEPPRLVDGLIRFVAGIDPVAGGTWLGINARGVIVAITNRPKLATPSASRSRGLLVRELLACSTAAEAADHATKNLSRNLYAGCNLLCVDKLNAVVLHAGDWLRVRPLPPGLHVLTAHDVNDENDRRTEYALRWLASQALTKVHEWVNALKDLCGQTGNGGPPICLHGDQGGTVSGTILSLGQSKEDCVYLHAQGAPDHVPYTDYSHLLRVLLREP
ncbi:MAG: NRDE family protein [Gemmataceae bacterium]